MAKPLKFISDKFTKARGGYSRFLSIACENCGRHLCDYQKDGPGPLKRIYVDRIIEYKFIWKENKKFICPQCKKWLGIASKYKKENRRCIILFEGVVKKYIKRI